MRRVDPSDRRPLYRQISDQIRDAIDDGTLEPGQLLPTEASLSEVFGASVDAVRQGLTVLRGESLITTERGKGSRVRRMPPRVTIHLPPGARVTSRMPTPDEREALADDDGRPIPEGVPVIVVEADGGTRLYAGDRVALETTS